MSNQIHIDYLLFYDLADSYLTGLDKRTESFIRYLRNYQDKPERYKRFPWQVIDSNIWEAECSRSKMIVQIMEEQGLDMVSGEEGSPEFIQSHNRWHQIRDLARTLEVDTREIIDTMNYIMRKSEEELEEGEMFY